MVGHHPAMEHDIDGDEGDDAPQRARPSRYMKSVGMLGALTIYCFIVTDDKRYSPMWQSWKWHVEFGEGGMIGRWGGLRHMRAREA